MVKMVSRFCEKKEAIKQGQIPFFLVREGEGSYRVFAHEGHYCTSGGLKFSPEYLSEIFAENEDCFEL